MEMLRTTLTYPPAVAGLVEDRRVGPLGAGSPNMGVREQLAALRPADLTDGRPIADGAMAECCLAGLWLRHSFLDESHQISQRIETTTGSYWHAIMHRREGDFENAKYWFRRVGRHDVFESLAASVAEIADRSDAPIAKQFTAQSWNPMAFVDACHRVRAGSPDEQLLCEIADQEWRLLFDYCYMRSIGGP